MKLVRVLAGHTDVVRSVAFAPQGGTLASGSRDKTVKLWEYKNGRLLHTLAGHGDRILGVAFDPQDGTMASGSADRTVKLWEAASGRLLRTIAGHQGQVMGVAFSPQGGTLAGGSSDQTVKLWEAASGRLLHTLGGHQDWVRSVAFSPQVEALASGSDDKTVKLWEAASGRLLRTLDGHSEAVFCVAFSPQGGTLASGSSDHTVKHWEAASGRLLRTLEGHTGPVDGIAFSPDGQLLASKSADHTIRLWSCATWETVAVIPVPTRADWWIPALAFDPAATSARPLLATASSPPDTPQDKCSREIHLFELDCDVLLGRVSVSGKALAAGRSTTDEPAASAVRLTKTVHSATAKIVLVGDSGVGKTGLGWRLAHGEYREHDSTHGQQFWVLNQLATTRKDGTQCEAVLWDLAGQPDYRLIHALSIQDADLALVLFDPTNNRDPLGSVEYWLRQLPAACPKVLVAARVDRGHPVLTDQELNEFCRRQVIAGSWIATSARENFGIDELLQRIKQAIPWDLKVAVSTDAVFKRIKDLVLALRESRSRKQVIQTAKELGQAIRTKSKKASEPPLEDFTDAQLLTAIWHLSSQGFVRMLTLSSGEELILLVPELLNNLAASIVLEARRNERGLGAIEEGRLFDGSYGFRELEGLPELDKELLLDGIVQFMTVCGLCYRHGDHLVFPSLQSTHAADKPLREARQLLAEGNLVDARMLFDKTIIEYPEFGPFLRDELGFIFDFDADLASEQSKWQSRVGQIEWRRRVWAIVAQNEIEFAQQVDTSPIDVGPKQKEAAKRKEMPVTDGKKAKVTTMTSEEKGEALEQAVEELFRVLFRVDDVDSVFETFELSQQQRGTQLGFDIKLVFFEKRTGARVRCFFECKAQEDKITLNTVAEKVAAIDTFQSQPDHWVLIAPRAATQNGLKNVIDDWDDRDKYDFDIQLWTKGNQTEELFGLVPKLYDLWFEDVPDDERIDPSKWSNEKRIQIAAKWRNKLEAPLRLPVGWPDYVRDHRHLKTFSDESDDVLDELRSRHIEPRGLDETGAPLPEDLQTTIENWLESSTKSLILLGDFGDGKTATTYLISLRLVRRFRVNPKESWLPLRCSLRDFSRDGVRDGRDFLRRRVEEFKADIAGWEHLARRHKAFVILDGLDEMTTALDPKSVQVAIDRLLDCCGQEFRDLKILLTCRTPFFHAMPEREYLLGELESPVIITMRNFERRDVLDQLAEQATTPAHRQRLQALRTMHDPIGLAGKPLFFQMVSETLWDPDSDCSNAVGLYESYIRKSLLRKVDLLRAEKQRISREELVERLLHLLEMVAVEILRGKKEFACLKKIATQSEDVEYARLLWKHSNASDVVEYDATARLGIRSLLRRVDPGLEHSEDEFWPVDFCHRSMREFFVAKTLERVIRESTSKAKELLAKTDLSIETIRFAALLMRRNNQPAKYHAALRALAEQSRKPGSDLCDSERTRLGKNAVTLLFKAEAQLSEVDWNDMALDGVDLAGANLTGKNFSGTSLRHAILDNANFSNADFSNSDLNGVLLDETAEIQSISVVRGRDEFVAAYADGRIRRWALDRSGSNVIYEQHMQARRLEVLNTPGSDLCLHIGNQLVFADQSNYQHVRRCEIRTQSDIAKLILAESTLLVVRERSDNSFVAELFDLQCTLPVKLHSISISSSWLCSAFSTKAIAFTVEADVVVQLLGNGTRNTICKMRKLSALSIGSISESEFLLGCGSQSGDLKVIRCRVADDNVVAAEVFAGHPHDSAISSIAFIEDHSVLTGGNDRKVVRSDLRAEAVGKILDTFALHLQCNGMNVTGLQSETERETLVALGAKTYT